MAFKFVLIIASIAIASAIEVQYNPEYTRGYNSGYNSAYNGGYSNGGAILVANAGEKYYDQPAQYDFAYGVKDLKTGDIKEQQESRKGDVVQGRYSLVDSDGYERVVEYAADAKNGFNAVVQRKPTKYQVPQVQVVQKVVAAPILTKYAVQAPTVYYGENNNYNNNGGYYNGEGASSYSSQSFGNQNLYNKY